MQDHALSAGQAAPYPFPELTGKSLYLSAQEVQLITTEAAGLQSDLKTIDLKRSVLIQTFRRAAQQALNSGKSLPPVPSAFHDLQQQRTAMIVQHMIKLRTKLGTSSGARLDDFVKREFSPHVSLRQLGHPQLNASFAK